ncbi:MAG: zinc-ribbon domain-containing protein, partial [Candidatus Hodarchaeota archaeon]
DNCKKFTDVLKEYCEYCGAKNSLRKATKEDYNQYRYSQLKKQIKTSKPITHVAQTKTDELQAIPTILDKKEVVTEWKEKLDKSKKAALPSEVSVASVEKDEKPEITIPSEIPKISAKIEEKPKVSIPSEISPVMDKEEEKPIITSYICKFCGKELKPKTTFCPQCGQIIKNK